MTTAEPVTEAQRIANSRTPETLFRDVIATLALHKCGKGEHGAPLWSVVGAMVGHGSGVSIEICERFGFNPHIQVRDPQFLDNRWQFIKGFCSKCEVEFGIEEGCPNGCEVPE